MCRVTTIHRPSKAEATTAWNTRLSPWIPVEDMPAFMTASPYPPSDKDWATKYLVLKHEALPEDVEIMKAVDIWLDEGSEVAVYMPIPELP